MSRRGWAAGVVAAAVALTSGTTAVALAAPAPSAPHPVPDVTVSRFVVRDAAGQVVARGATATLPGHRSITTPTTSAPDARVATARLGHGVVVQARVGTTDRVRVATR